MRDDTWEETLRCNLSMEEVADRADLCARRLADREQVENDLKAYAAGARANIKELKAEIDSLGRAVREHAEYRSVFCHEEEAFERNAIVTIRNDTNVVVRERAMEPDERQRAMFPRAAEERV